MIINILHYQSSVSSATADSVASQSPLPPQTQAPGDLVEARSNEPGRSATMPQRERVFARDLDLCIGVAIAYAFVPLSLVNHITNQTWTVSYAAIWIATVAPVQCARERGTKTNFWPR
jgi:hypothetical protein